MFKSLRNLTNISLIITLIFISLSLYSVSQATPSEHSQPKYNAQVEFEKMMQLHQGKIVYLDFWASWCVPCRKSFPWMNTMQAKHAKAGLIVLSINLDTQADLAAKFLVQHPADFTVIYDPKGDLAHKFQLKGMPSSFLFNRQGQITSAHSGFNARKQKIYEQEILQLLAQ